MLATVESIRRVTRTADGEVTATSMLERFGFTGDRLTARLGDLSGGERRRFQLLRLLLTEPNVLLLDEPTNDLDIETLNVLEDFLDGWPGTLVVVSHDRYFLERVTDSIWALLGDGQISMLPRGVDEYLERRAARHSAAIGGRTTGSRAGGTGRSHAEGQGRQRRGAGRPQDRGPDRQAARADRRRARPSCNAQMLRARPATTRGWPSSSAELQRDQSPRRTSSRRSGSRPPSSWSERRRSGERRRAARRSSWASRLPVAGRQVGEQLALGVEQRLEGAVDGGLALGRSAARARRAGRRGRGSARRSPRAASRSTRLVIVPLVTSVSRSSRPATARTARRRGAAPPARRTPTTRCRAR